MAKTLTGTVTSNVANKTITVTVTSRETHPIYGKQYSVNRKYAAHDESNLAKKGDKVIISETRPYSKTKSYKLDNVIEKSRGSIELKDEVVDSLKIKTPTKLADDVDDNTLKKRSNKTSSSKHQTEAIAEKEDK
jgi:small subunit ribosomal protein S17